MRFTSFLVAGVLALTASAQSVTTTDGTTATSTTTSVQATDSAQAAQAACLKACAAGDVNCQAHCITVPSPDETAVNKTNECSAACPQGNGTQAETDAYAECLQNCVNLYYYSTSVGTPTGTAAAAGGSGSSASVTAVVTTVTSGSSTFTSTFSKTVAVSSSGTASASGSGTSSSSGNAADTVFQPRSSYVGLLGAIAAVLAL